VQIILSSHLKKDMECGSIEGFGIPFAKKAGAARQMEPLPKKILVVPLLSRTHGHHGFSPARSCGMGILPHWLKPQQIAPFVPARSTARWTKAAGESTKGRT